MQGYLLANLASTAELDESIVFAKLGRLGGWRTWPTGEREAIETYLAAVWAAVLARFPATVGAFDDAAGFLTAIHRDDLARTCRPGKAPAPWRRPPGRPAMAQLGAGA